MSHLFCVRTVTAVPWEKPWSCHTLWLHNDKSTKTSPMRKWVQVNGALTFDIHMFWLDRILSVTSWIRNRICDSRIKHQKGWKHFYLYQRNFCDYQRPFDHSKNNIPNTVFMFWVLSCQNLTPGTQTLLMFRLLLLGPWP